MRILLVEDDKMIGEILCQALRRSGYAVDWAKDGETAEESLSNHAYELMLLDFGLPKKSGLDVLIGLRRRKDALPVLALTARDGLGDKVAGLDAGADDYLVKPFELEELEARIRALSRRRSGRVDPVMEHGGMALSPVTRELTAR